MLSLSSPGKSGSSSAATAGSSSAATCASLTECSIESSIDKASSNNMNPDEGVQAIEPAATEIERDGLGSEAMAAFAAKFAPTPNVLPSEVAMELGSSSPRPKNLEGQPLSTYDLIHRQQQHEIGAQPEHWQHHDVPSLSPLSARFSNEAPWCASETLLHSRQRLSLESRPLTQRPVDPPGPFPGPLAAFGAAIDERKARWASRRAFAAPTDKQKAQAGSTSASSRRIIGTGADIMNSSSKLMRRLLRSGNDGSPLPALHASLEIPLPRVPYTAAAKPVLLRRSFDSQPGPFARAGTPAKLPTAAPEDLAESLLQITTTALDDPGPVSKFRPSPKVCIVELPKQTN